MNIKPLQDRELKQFVADIAIKAKHYPLVPPEPIAIPRRNNLAVARKDPLGSYWHEQLEHITTQTS
jgi:hypothetical protein